MPYGLMVKLTAIVVGLFLLFIIGPIALFTWLVGVIGDVWAMLGLLAYCVLFLVFVLPYLVAENGIRVRFDRMVDRYDDRT